MLTIDGLIKGVKDLVPLPKAYLRIQQLVFDPDSSLDDVTKVIMNDAGLTSRILRIANSAYMGLVSKVDTVGRAVQVLGLSQVHDLALAGAAVGTLTKIETPSLDPGTFWRRSAYCAVVARIISKQRRLRSAERLFVSGLLHDTGHLLLAHRHPERYAEIRARAIDTGRTMAAIEQEELGFTYADLGAALLRSWQLPEEIVIPVAYHAGHPCEVPDAHLSEVSIVHVGSVIYRAAMWRSDVDEPVPDFESAALQLNAVDDEKIEAIMNEADDGVIEAMTLLLPKTSTSKRRTVAAPAA